MEETINVRIKLTPGNPPRPATTKVFLDKKRFGKHTRALEPGEVIALPRDAAEEMLNHLPYELEMTMDEATRPLAFKSQHEAAITSTQNTMINRSEQIKSAHQAAVERVREEMREREELIRREEAIARREAELGLAGPNSEKHIEAEPSVGDVTQVSVALLDEEVREPRNNAMSRDELDALRKGEEDAATAEAQAEPVKRKRRGRPPKNPQPETTA